jgi:hypothetical protein
MRSRNTSKSKIIYEAFKSVFITDDFAGIDVNSLKENTIGQLLMENDFEEVRDELWCLNFIE